MEEWELADAYRDTVDEAEADNGVVLEADSGDAVSRFVIKVVVGR